MPGPLRFRPDGTFTIAQFTDLHWHNGEPADQQTRALMERVLELEQPDCAVLTGDVINGKGCKDPARSWEQAVRPLVESGIPWAAVFGNHDDEGTLSRQELMQVQRSCVGCLSEPGPGDVSGVGNYWLTVYGNKQVGDGSKNAHLEAASGAPTPGEPAAVLYFLDSNSYANTGIGGYGWIEADQIGWYRRTAVELARIHGQRLPALAFFHIPLPEYNDVWDAHLCWGEKHEDVCCPRINSGFFAALHEMGDVMGAFVGHDHVNDYVGELHGIRLCYGRASGCATYGREGFPRGARLIRLRLDVGGFETWLRLADGSAVARQAEHPPQGRVLSA